MHKKWRFGVFISFIMLFLVASPSVQGCYWYFDKETIPAGLTELTLMPGQSYVVNYQVTSIASFNPFNPSSPHLPTCSLQVYDTFGSENPVLLGVVAYPGDLDIGKVFNYSKILQYDICGDYTVENSASLFSLFGDFTGIADSLSINVRVPCDEGCTLTPGYWKTHSQYGPAPYDNTWAQLPDVDEDALTEGENETFFQSGQSWYQVLWTPPAGGNAYYILAHAYIAARLNELNGASATSAVDAAKAWAESFFGNNTPSTRLKRALRNEAIGHAGVLDQYNNGYTGPGHCSE